MEWSEKTAAAVAEWAGDERDERPIDGEFTLPDYWCSSWSSARGDPLPI